MHIIRVNVVYVFDVVTNNTYVRRGCDFVGSNDETSIFNLSQTSFSLYLHNQWTDFFKLSCTRKSQMRAICTYAKNIRATTNDWDIRPSVAVKALSANISWTAGWIHMIKLALGSAYQFGSNDIWCVSKQ